MTYSVTTTEYLTETKRVADEVPKPTLVHNPRPLADYCFVNIVAIVLAHAYAVYALKDIFYVKWETILLRVIEGILSGLGVTAGAHRLWCHRSYKAKTPLKVFLLFCYTMAGQNNVFNWVRDHRVHHKYSETDADPHNARRGLFFSHVGWLMFKKHPEVSRKGRKIDMSDIRDDPIIAFHTRYFFPLKILLCNVIPTILPVYLFGETWQYSFASMIIRYVITLNSTWSVNSFAHLWGNKPFDNRIFPAQNVLVAIAAMGEGWHNYHHVFPWDYKADELGGSIFNLTTVFIDAMASIGWAYDRKAPSKELIERTALAHGDGTRDGHSHGS